MNTLLPVRPSPADCTCFRVRSAARRVTQIYSKHLAPTGLKISQFSLLGFVTARGPVTITELSDLLATRDADTLERLALGLTPISKVALAGVTWPVSSHWQLGGEFRVSSLTGTEGFGALPAQAGTGSVYTGTLQAIGSGVFTETGVVTLTSSRLSADAYDAWLLAANSRFRIGSRWIIEPAVRWYRQDNVAGSQLTRVAPTLRMLFQWREHFSLEGEMAYERSRSDSALLDETDNILFYYFGFRWDF